MSLHLTNSSNVTDNATLELGGASYVTTAQVGDATYVFVASKFDNGVSVFSLDGGGTLHNVFNVADNNTMQLGGAFALTTTVVGGTTYLYVTGINDYGITGFSIGADGSLTNVANVADNATLQIALTVDVETAVVGGTTYLFSAGVNDNGVSVFAVNANGTLTNVDNINDDATASIQGPQGMTTATVGGNTYLFVTGFHDDGVGVYSVATDGHLTNVFNVHDSGDLELDGPVDATTAVVGGTTYLFVSGFEDDGISVFSVAADGHLTNVFNLANAGDLKLDDPVGMSTTVLDGKTYLVVAGADADGLSVFLVGADGHLTNVANVSDDSTLQLDRPIGVTTVTVNGHTYVIAASNNDNGVSVFSFFDDTNHAPTLAATANNPTFTEGGAAADIFSAPLAATADPGQSFTSLKLTVSNVTDGAHEILSFLGHDLTLTDGNSVAGVTVSVTGTTATVTFPGAPDAAALQQLIDDLAYRNNSQNPTDADRVITITQLTDSGGTADGGVDTAALSIASTVHVAPVNTAATISGTASGDVTEAGANDNGTPGATGNLDSTDPDGANDAWSVVPSGTASISGHGSYAVAANGQWTYTLDNTDAAVQALNDGDTLTDTFNAVTADGTTQLVTITIHGQNDAAQITGKADGAVTEGGAGNGGTPTTSGDLDAADVDNTNDAWQAVAAGAASIGGFGTYALTAAGVWTYTLDNTNGAVQALKAGDTLTDTFNAVTADGTTQLVTVTIHGQNDGAQITGKADGSVTEAGAGGAGTPTASGDLDAADVDNTNDAWQAVAAGAATDHDHGTYALTAAGVWTYTLDNTDAAVQALKAGDTLADTFNAVTADGTSQLVTITIHGRNDAAQITGDATGAVIRSGDGGAGIPTDTGDLDAVDVDNINDAWRAVAAGATDHGYGSYKLTAAGVWTYTLDNTNAAVQALKAGDTLTDSFTALTEDGTAQVVTVTINGQNDAPVIDLNGAGAGTGAALTFTEGGAPTPFGNLTTTIADANDAQLQSATIVLANAFAGDVLNVADLSGFGLTSEIDTSVAGRITVTLTGAASLANYQGALRHVGFSSTSENPSTVERHIEISVSDGQLKSNTAVATVAVVSLDDVPVNTVPNTQDVDANHALTIAGLAVADPDAGAAAITTSLSVAHGTLTVGALGGLGIAGSGTNTVTLTGSIAQINAALAAAGNVVYTPGHDLSGTDTLTMTTNDHGNSGPGGPLSDTDTVKINVHAAENAEALLTGTPGADSFVALPGNERIDALGGVDTISFGFKLTDATVSYAGNTVTIDGPAGSHTVLTGFEKFVFTDGTVDNNDADPLVDDLFYYSHNHDVWNAHVDADAHYNQSGWHEGRNPNAFFDTDFYLSLYPDVKASGANPLAQFDQSGWSQGRAPSLNFDVAKYLAANPDIAAAHVDPLAHFLANGAQEGRQPFPLTEFFAPNGFDYVYYLQHNPDVAAAHVDPFLHFETVGWKEGRNPNTLFDVNGYLATYADVKAAGVNPLDHYHQTGWQEGRDPSVNFDTADYLSHNADVAAAHVDPLLHFLQTGIHEGRSSLADGVFG